MPKWNGNTRTKNWYWQDFTSWDIKYILTNLGFKGRRQDLKGGRCSNFGIFMGINCDVNTICKYLMNIFSFITHQSSLIFDFQRIWKDEVGYKVNTKPVKQKQDLLYCTLCSFSHVSYYSQLFYLVISSSNGFGVFIQMLVGFLFFQWSH